MSRAAAASPLKSFVDLSCGAFGAVMLLAVVLIRAAPPSNSAALPSGRIAVSVPTAVPAAEVERLNSFRVRIVVPGAAPREFALPELIGKPFRSDGEPKVVVSAATETADGPGGARLRLTVSADRLASPIGGVVTVFYQLPPGIRVSHGGLFGGRDGAGVATVSAVGDAFSPEALADVRKDGSASLEPANGFAIRFLFDPAETRAVRAVAIEADGPTPGATQ